MDNHKQDCGIYHPYSEHTSEQKDGLDLRNMFALDLRKKNQYDPITVPERDKQGERDEGDRLSIEGGGSSTMLSPYSMSNSPKTESEGYYENSSQLKHNATLTNMCDTPGVTMATPQQSWLPMIPNEATKIPVAIPTMHVPTIPCIIHNEAERKISLTVPAHSECSTSTDVQLITSSLNTGKKAARPFKAYQRNLISPIARVPFHSNSDESYAKFRKHVLEKMQTNPPPKTRRASKSPGLPTSTVDEKDAAYWERRRKNNEAAKRSRELRRAKEDELAIRAIYLEQENEQLKYKVKELELILKTFVR